MTEQVFAGSLHMPVVRNKKATPCEGGFLNMARLAGFEPTTPWFVGWYGMAEAGGSVAARKSDKEFGVSDLLDIYFGIYQSLRACYDSDCQNFYEWTQPGG